MPFSSPADQIKAVLQTLQQSFGAPLWREPLPAVDELISTILSQNTNDVNRDRAFYALRQTFADWEAVRAAPEEEIIAAVRVAGLANLKGPRIKAVLNQIHDEVGSLDLSFLADMPLEEARTEAPERSGQLMSALDQVNRKFGKGTLKVASAGLEGDRREWEMKQERRTPRYTTDWGDVPVVRAS